MASVARSRRVPRETPDYLTDEQERAVLRFGEAAGWRSVKSSFTADERKQLLDLGLFPEQVARLESNALKSIGWRQARPPTMTQVRETLIDLQKPLRCLTRVYLKMSTSRTAGNAEALGRIYMAQEALGFDPLKPEERDKLHDSLETATEIVQRALEDLPQSQRRGRSCGAEFIRLIHHALKFGHTDHFRCKGYGDTGPESQPMPAFMIRVTRTRKANHRKRRGIPFGEIAFLVSQASGEWSSDDAIRAYQAQRRKLNSAQRKYVESRGHKVGTRVRKNST